MAAPATLAQQSPRSDARVWLAPQEDLSSGQAIPDTGFHSEIPSVYLRPGEACLARRPSVLKTILGSCVGATFWHAGLQVAALCHGILPTCPEGVTAPEGYRYVDFAIRDLIRRFELLGASRKELEVQVFGGADVLPLRNGPSRALSVGQANLQTALQILRDENCNVVAADLGGRAGRTVQFHSWNGTVILRRLSSRTW